MTSRLLALVSLAASAALASRPALGLAPRDRPAPGASAAAAEDAAARLPPEAGPVPAIPFETFRLPNGLHVILSEDHSAPIVGVDVHYDVGSKDEKPGRTGFAHLFEHLMFQGTAHLPKGEADRLIDNVGGSSNGGTSQDATTYWQQVPSNALEQALYIESERMGWLLPTLDQAKLDNQREVVRNERRESYEMQPYGTSFVRLEAELWDPDFPYHWLPIGSHEDLAAATLDDVREFFHTWYGPSNASLAIAGDFDPREARRLVEKWFGAIPASPPPPHRAPAPKPLTAEKRVSMDDDVELPRLYLAWQTPRFLTQEDAVLDMLGSVLADGKSARLVRRLVIDERIAQGVSAGQGSQQLASSFVVVATPKPGVDPARLLAEIDEELSRLATEPPSAVELQRAVNKAESGAVFSLEPVGGFGGRAATLNRYWFAAGDPGYLPKDIARYRRVKPEDVRDAAARFLRKDARVVLTVMPRKAAAPPAQPDSPKLKPRSTKGQRPRPNPAPEAR